MLTNSLLYLSWLPKTKLLAGRFARYWLRDLWLYGTIVFAGLFVSSNMFYKGVYHTPNILVSDDSMRIVSGSSNKILKNLSHLNNILKVHGVSEKDRVNISNLISKHFDKAVLADAKITLSGQFISDSIGFKISSLIIKTQGVEFEVVTNETNDYVLNILDGDQMVKLKVSKASSLKSMLRKVSVPFSVINQCKKAYASNQFRFNSAYPSYLVYQNPGKNAKDYKLMLIGNGDTADSLQGIILTTQQLKLSNRKVRYNTAFDTLGTKVTYKTTETIRYEDQFVDLAAGSMVHPLPGAIITSPYGYRTIPRKGFHHGIDYRGARGTPIQCALNGKVLMAQRYGAYGNVVIVSHGDLKTVYGHMHQIKVKAGDNVKAGTILGTVGATGRATGPHLHFEVRKNNKTVNPLLYVGNSKGKAVKKAIRDVKKERIVVSETSKAKALKMKLLDGLC